jgi:integrase
MVLITVLNTVLKFGQNMDRISLDDRSVAGLQAIGGKQIIVRDDDLSGFFVMVGTRTKAYMIQGDLWTEEGRKSIRLKVGEAGQMTSREARAKAKVLLGQIANGIDPRPKPEPQEIAKPAEHDPALRVAWNSYLASHMERKGRSHKTIQGYRDHVERLMVDWLDTPLSELGKDPALVKAKHDALTINHGPYMANACMRSFRAIYTHARKSARSLPAENPVFAVDWNPERRRDSGMGPKDLPEWFQQCWCIDNPLRRELHLFLLLSGSRPDAIKRARIEHVDFAQRQLFVPTPKGGAEKAFYIPLSREMMRCLARAMRFGQMMHREEGKIWIFPSEGEAGHISEHKEDRKLLSHWGNDLRQTFRTMGQVAGAGDVDMHLLMNHSLPGVNAGYITRARLVDTHLRKVQQMISTTIFDCLRGTKLERSSWPFASARNILRNELPERVHTRRGEGAQSCSRNMAVFRESSTKPA